MTFQDHKWSHILKIAIPGKWCKIVAILLQATNRNWRPIKHWWPWVTFKVIAMKAMKCHNTQPRLEFTESRGLVCSDILAEKVSRMAAFSTNCNLSRQNKQIQRQTESCSSQLSWPPVHELRSASRMLQIWVLLPYTIVRYDMRCYFNVRSKADILLICPNIVFIQLCSSWNLSWHTALCVPSNSCAALMHCHFRTTCLPTVYVSCAGHTAPC